MTDALSKATPLSAPLASTAFSGAVRAGGRFVSTFRSSIRSQIIAPELLINIIARPHSYGHHCQRRILAPLRDEARAVGHEEVLDVPALIEFVEHRYFRGVAHSRRADFVDAQPRVGQVLVGVLNLP